MIISDDPRPRTANENEIRSGSAESRLGGVVGGERERSISLLTPHGCAGWVPEITAAFATSEYLCNDVPQMPSHLFAKRAAHGPPRPHVTGRGEERLRPTCSAAQ
jgi:hypothetical protein